MNKIKIEHCVDCGEETNRIINNNCSTCNQLFHQDIINYVHKLNKQRIEKKEEEKQKEIDRFTKEKREKEEYVENMRIRRQKKIDYYMNNPEILIEHLIDAEESICELQIKYESLYEYIKLIY